MTYFIELDLDILFRILKKDNDDECKDFELVKTVLLCR